MRQEDFAEILALEKRIYAKLNEVLGITRELAEAVDRQDRVCVQMLLADRQQPILELRDLDASARLKRCDLIGEDERQFDRLFSGGAAQSGEERVLTDQLAANRRLLERAVELDRRVNRRICREKSCYLTHEKKTMSR